MADRACEAAAVTGLRKPLPCSHCGRPSTRAAYPFCSVRCADVDLHAWLGGRYAIAVTEEDSGLPLDMSSESAADPLDKPSGQP